MVVREGSDKGEQTQRHGHGGEREKGDQRIYEISFEL